MKVDTFWTDFERVLVPKGWLLDRNSPEPVSNSRYDPTHLEGIVPSGKVFTFHYAGDMATLTVAGRVQSALLSRLIYEAGDMTVGAIETLYLLFPAGHR